MKYFLYLNLKGKNFLTPQMKFKTGFATMSKIINGHTTSVAWFLCSFLLLLHVTTIVSAKTEEDRKVVDIGVIFNYDSQMWKEVYTAIEIACREYNKSFMGNYELRPHYMNSHGSPLRAVSAARKLINQKKVKVIIGLNEWQEAVLVAELCNRFQILVISLARSPLALAPTTAPPWPLLIQMSTNMLEQIRCIADIIYALNKRRVSIIYEEEAFGDSDSGILSHLYKEIDVIGSEVVDLVLLPTFSSSLNSQTLLKQSLAKIKAQPSSFIIVLQLSLPMTSTLLKEGKRIGLFREGCEWIFAESPLSLLYLVDPDLTSSMKYVIGIMPYHSRNNLYIDFIRKFGHEFGWDRKEVLNNYPRIHASRAYDIISAISKAIEKIPSDHFNSRLLFKNVIQNKFIGLSGEIYYESGQLLHSTNLEIVRFGGKNESKELISFWSPEIGFSKNMALRMGLYQDVGVEWASRPMQSVVEARKELKIGVPRKTFFDKFVKEKIDGKIYEGFCIDVFSEILGSFNHKLNFVYHPHDGSYDELVQMVNNKTYDAAVGDVTILANRSKLVEFTQAYVESGLSMIVPAQPDPEKGWLFIKPFTPLMWAAFGGILIYIMFIVWVLEHKSNPEFSGPWTHQISTAMWFTFSSLFFAHRERVHRNFTRIVLVAWFFVALILTQSYTASLSSMLTVQGLRSNITTMEWLTSTNARVGCDNRTFVCDYLERVHDFKRENFVGINTSSDYDYGKEFQSANIAALFLEYPYEKAFLTKYCNGYVVTHQSYRFGGFGFVFPKGSFLVDNFSEAILELSESGAMKRLQDKWFSPECILTNTTISLEAQRLSLDSFSGLLISTFGVSTLILLLSLVCFKKSHQIEHKDSLERELNAYNAA